MSGRRLERDTNARSLLKVSGGASYAITLPKAVVQAFKWKERQKLMLAVDEKKKIILIQDWKRDSSQKR